MGQAVLLAAALACVACSGRTVRLYDGSRVNVARIRNQTGKHHMAYLVAVDGRELRSVGEVPPMEPLTVAVEPGEHTLRFLTGVWERRFTTGSVARGLALVPLAVVGTIGIWEPRFYNREFVKRRDVTYRGTFRAGHTYRVRMAGPTPAPPHVAAEGGKWKTRWRNAWKRVGSVEPYEIWIVDETELDAITDAVD